MNRRVSHFYRRIKSAYDNLIAMGLRSLLTMLGIIIGTGSVVAMVSGGQMATEASLQNIRALGTNLIAATLVQLPFTSNQQKVFVSLEQALDIKSIDPAIEFSAPYMNLYYSVNYQGNNLNSSIIATTKDLADILHLKMQTGRFISPYDKFELFCVIGYQLFLRMGLNETNAAGTHLHIGNNIFTVIGVIAPWTANSFFTEDVNKSIIIPIDTIKLLNQPIDITHIIMRFNEDANINEIESSLNRYAARTWPDKKLELRSPKDLIASSQKQSHIFNILLGFIGGISLLVGGIGVMNTMLVSVLERRQEIGIRLALGATPAEIQWMFLSEAIILAVTGGFFGILLGIICSFIVSKFTHWPFLFLYWPAVVGFLISFLTGAFFGYYPAHHASTLNIIDTLRVV